jgi:hypothetical protein
MAQKFAATHNRRILGALVVLAASAFSFPVAHSRDASDADRVLALLDEMEHAWAGVSDYVKEVEKTERLISGRLTRQTVLVKFRRPDEHYTRCDCPCWRVQGQVCACAAKDSAVKAPRPAGV